ncbi:hypothetical protein ALC62_01143, partial [Cyphomyrmex costatus]
NEDSLAAPARQEGPGDPHISGVYVLTGSVFAECRPEKKYSSPDTLSFLRAPGLNPECRSALKNNLIVKRDDFNHKDQDQVGIVLAALGETVSDFLSLDTRSSLGSDARAVISTVNDGAMMLADLFYLSPCQGEPD